MSIICDNCGFENEDNELFCAVCNHPLQAETNAAPVQPIMAEERVNTLPQTPVKMVSPGGKYYVICEECRGKTYVSGPDIASYFCSGCQKEQFIDGIFWSVEEEQPQEQPMAEAVAVSERFPTAQPTVSHTATVAQAGSMGNRLVLEDIDTGKQIEISKAGGTLGRYGTFGADYFQTDPRGSWISGEHCRITYSEDTGWMLEHLSRTNDTVYNSRKLEHGYQERLRDGKLLVLANKMTFRIRML